MKTLNFKSERETEEVVIELIRCGVCFSVTGRNQIIIK